jgi:hypothetical protein
MSHSYQGTPLVRGARPRAWRRRAVAAALLLSAGAWTADDGLAQTPAPARPASPAASRPAPQAARAASAIPRAANGKPNLQGIWRVRNAAAQDLQDHAARQGMRPGLGVVDGGEIPYLPAAAEQKNKNYLARETADPLTKCYLPGVPRIMYLDYPFHIFQTPTQIAMTFEWSHVFRVVPVNGSKPHEGIEFWMGDSRGRWDGDTLVVDVTNFNDKTWFDHAGNFHSEALRLVERYTLLDADTLRYQVTVTDPKVFSRPWTMTMSMYRQKEMARVLEYHCQAEVEEANGAFERDPRTWYPKP